MNASLVLAKIVFSTHVFMMLIIVFGWALPLQFIKFHLLLVPATMIQWWFNDNQCVLTQIQCKLEGKTAKKDEQGQFIKELFQKFGLNPSERFLFFFIYGLMGASFSFSLWRQFLFN